MFNVPIASVLVSFILIIVCVTVDDFSVAVTCFVAAIVHAVLYVSYCFLTRDKKQG